MYFHYKLDLISETTNCFQLAEYVENYASNVEPAFIMLIFILMGLCKKDLTHLPLAKMAAI